MEQQVEVAIIGAGSAGLYALGQVKRGTDSYVMVDGGELGTTCARVGCMPSKAMIQVAEDFHRRMIFSREGIEGGFELEVNGADALEHVQDLRDIFVDKVLSTTTDHMGEEFIPEYARFLEPDLLAVGERRIRAKRIVIATGSIPKTTPFPGEYGPPQVVTTVQVLTDEVETGDKVLLIDQDGHHQATGTAELLADRGIELDLSQSAKKKLAEDGYDPAYGARPLKRVIQRELQDPLALAGNPETDHYY